MAEKIRLGEATVSGRLVRDPVQVKSRTGRQIHGGTSVSARDH